VLFIPEFIFRHCYWEQNMMDVQSDSFTVSLNSWWKMGITSFLMNLFFKSVFSHFDISLNCSFNPYFLPLTLVARSLDKKHKPYLPYLHNDRI